MSRTKFDYPTEYTDDDLAELHAERAKVAKLREALAVFEHEWVLIARSGNLGKWDWEKDYFLVNARKALDETK